jgi:tetratricopeptide (TPR) repeat protein
MSRKVSVPQRRFGSRMGSGIETVMTPLSLDPESARLFQQSSDLYDHGEFDKAVILLSAVLMDAPDCVPALIRRGMILTEMDAFERALKDFEAAIRLEPDNGLAYFGRGWVRGNLGDPQGEIDDARHGLSIDPANESMYYRRIGHGLQAQGRYQEALDAYNHALELTPNQLGTIYNRAVCYVELEHFEQAISEFDQILERNPKWAWPLCWRGWAYYRLGQTQRALIDTNLALRFSPTYDLAYLRRAMIERDRGDIEQAKADLNKVLDLTHNTEVRQQAERLLKA